MGSFFFIWILEQIYSEHLHSTNQDSNETTKYDL